MPSSVICMSRSVFLCEAQALRAHMILRSERWQSPNFENVQIAFRYLVYVGGTATILFVGGLVLRWMYRSIFS